MHSMAHRTRWGLLGVGLLTAFALHLLVGAFTLPLSDAWAGLLHGPNAESSAQTIMWQIRLPRSLAAMLVGGILGLTGAAFQSLFRNPLAEPFVIGVSGGAAVGGTLAIATGLSASVFGFGGVIGALIGGMAALSIVLRLSQSAHGLSVPRLLLAGVLVGALFSSLVTLVLVMAGKDSNQILGWLLGSLTPMYYPRVALLAFGLLFGLAALLPAGAQLNAMAVGESTAKSLGVSTPGLIRRVLWGGALASSIAVSVTGIIGFLGLLAPHLARKMVGVDARTVLPVSAVLGAGLLLLSDLLSQQLVRSLEMPVGAVTAVLGAIALIAILPLRES